MLHVLTSVRFTLCGLFNLSSLLESSTLYLLNKTSKLYFSSFDTSRLDNHAVLLRLISVAILLEAALSFVHTDTLLLLCGCLFTDFDAVAGTAAATTSSQFYAAACQDFFLRFHKRWFSSNRRWRSFSACDALRSFCTTYVRTTSSPGTAIKFQGTWWHLGMTSETRFFLRRRHLSLHSVPFLKGSRTSRTKAP